MDGIYKIKPYCLELIKEFAWVQRDAEPPDMALGPEDPYGRWDGRGEVGHLAVRGRWKLEVEEERVGKAEHLKANEAPSITQ